MINPKGKKVVFWLGAGASANALPVVGEMPSAFRMHATRITYYLEGEKPAFLKSHDAERYSQYLKKMADWSEQYGTIDTYARSLFLLKEKDRLAELKLHLGMFFLLEQALFSKSDIHISGFEPSYEKRDRIDTRYMGWLALLMEQDAGISNRVKVVSWNYDLQVEHAVAIFRGYRDLSELHSDPNIRFFPRPVEDHTQYLTLPTVVRLNGIAGHAKIGEFMQVLYNALHNTGNDVTALIHRLFELYKDYDKKEQVMLRAMTETLTFAWEGNSVAQTAFELAQRVMAEADILVVIGYSFPSFNRAIDKKLYGAFNSRDPAHKHVVIQNKALSSETFKRMLGQTGTNPNVLVETNTDQFYIPSELF